MVVYTLVLSVCFRRSSFSLGTRRLTPVQSTSCDVIAMMCLFFCFVCPQSPAELIEVGQKGVANQALYDIVTDNQGRRRMWSKTMEGIVLKLMELSVELRKPMMIKEALHKYRAMSMQSNVGSLEDVVRALVLMAEKRTEEARAAVLGDSDKLVLGAEDLEESAMETPETLLMEAAGAEQTADRIDRQQVVPWMRFLWDIYRTVLDIVKSHVKLESVYHEMAVRAFSFCVRYTRFMEFRRLCDMMRQHLNTLIKYPRTQANDVQISVPETVARHVETRFTQLQSAVELQHWQEAMRTVEDIHLLLGMTKARPRASLMSTYYGQLVKVFWVSGNVLYHAHALNKQYTLSVKQNRNLSAAAAQEMASRLMLAALCVPPYDPQAAHLAESYGFSDTAGMAAAENVARRNRLAALLGLNTPPEREPLIAELLTKGVHKAVHPELLDVYAALEVDVSPLRLAERLQPALDFLEGHAELSLYAAPLRRVGIFRLLQQLCRVYDVMHIDELRRVASFAPFAEVEHAVLDALKTRALALRFDHRNSCIRFQSTLFSSEGMRAQLGTLATRLATAMTMLQQPGVKSEAGASLVAKRAVEAEARGTVAVQEAKDNMEKEREVILARKGTIEERKERLGRLVAEAQRTAAVAAAAAAARRAAEEARKQEEETRRRELERLHREVEAREQQALRQLKNRLEAEAAQAAGKEVASVREAAPGVDVDNADEPLDREKILTQQHDEQVKARKDLEKKVLRIGRHMDYFDRASREAQHQLILDEHERAAADSASAVAAARELAIENARAQHARDLTAKARLMNILPAVESFLTPVLERADAEFNEWKHGEAARAAAQAAREAEAAAVAAAEAEAERQRQEQEAAREREAIEAARLAAEEAERLAAEREAENARVSDRIRLKEAEMERRRNDDRARSLGIKPPPAVGATNAIAASMSERPGAAGSASGKYVPVHMRSGATPAAMPPPPPPSSSDRYAPPVGDAGSRYSSAGGPPRAGMSTGGPPRAGMSTSAGGPPRAGMSMSAGGPPRAGMSAGGPPRAGMSGGFGSGGGQEDRYRPPVGVSGSDRFRAAGADGSGDRYAPPGGAGGSSSGPYRPSGGSRYASSGGAAGGASGGAFGARSSAFGERRTEMGGGGFRDGGAGGPSSSGGFGAMRRPGMGAGPPGGPGGAGPDGGPPPAGERPRFKFTTTARQQAGGGGGN